MTAEQALKEERRRSQTLERRLALAETAAILDPLTRIANRRGLDGELARLVRSSQRFSFALVDLDDFKGINDTHGHLVGDLVLQSVAGSLAAGLRRTDYIARYGGDEFAIVLFGARAEPTTARLRQLIAEVAERPLVYERDGLPVPVTVRMQFGVAARGRDDTVSSLIQRADRALYAAKRGRSSQRVPAA